MTDLQDISDETEILDRSKRVRCEFKWNTEHRCPDAGYWGYPGNHHCRWDHLPIHTEHTCVCSETLTEEEGDVL